MARSHSLVAVRRLIDLMMGELRGPDGALVSGQDAAQMRLAMNGLLNRAGVVDEVLGDEDGEVRIIGIKVERYEEDED